MISDSYKSAPVVDTDGTEIPGMFEVESKSVAVGGDNVDIGCGNAFGGAGEDEGVEDSVATENNIVSERVGFGYNQMRFTLTELKMWLKDYFQKIRVHMRTAGVEQEKIKQMMGDAGTFDDDDYNNRLYVYRHTYILVHEYLHVCIYDMYMKGKSSR